MAGVNPGAIFFKRYAKADPYRKARDTADALGGDNRLIFPI